MEKNLSEELKINDDIVLDDGSELKSEEEKEAKKLQDEIQKDLDEKNKFAEEIKDAEAPKAEANNGEGKSLKIKHFVEKLVLEEPSDSLNEDIEDYDDAMYRDSMTHQVFNILKGYAKEYIGLKYRDEILSDLEDVCNEALMHIEEIIDYPEEFK